MNIFRRNHNDYPMNTTTTHGPAVATNTDQYGQHGLHHNTNTVTSTQTTHGFGNTHGNTGIRDNNNTYGVGNTTGTYDNRGTGITGHHNNQGAGLTDQNNTFGTGNTTGTYDNRGAGVTGHHNNQGAGLTGQDNSHGTGNITGHHNRHGTDNLGRTNDSYRNGNIDPTRDGYENGKFDGRHDGRHGAGRRRGFLSRNRDRQPRQDRHHDRRHDRHHEKRDRRPLFDLDSGDFNRRPSFGQWLKFTWLDILTMAAMGAVGLGVYNADPAPSRSFPITFLDGNVVYPQFAYPLRTEIVPIWEAALLASLVPIAVILLMQIRIRSFWDVNNGVIGLLYSLITAAVFQVFVKWLIGGLRPHFLYVCAPDLSRVVSEGGQGFRNLMFRRDICTGDHSSINDSLESMPSGHSTAAFAGFVYLYCYLNAKLKVFANYHPAMWKILAVYAPILGATLIAGSLTIDEYHNWYDCLAGAIIGTIMAFSAYRMVYASVWDFRFNHIPLTRHTPFSYGAGPAGAGGFESAVWTRQAGWGFEEAYGGAPFDAAVHLRGAQEGFNTNVHNNDHEKHNGGGLFGKHHDRRDGDVERDAGVNGYGTGTATGRDVGGGVHDGRHGVTGGVHDRSDGVRDGVNDGRGIGDGVHDGRHGVTDGVHDNRHGVRDGVNDSVRDDLRDGRRDVDGRHDGMNRHATDGTLDGTREGNRYKTNSRSLERKAVRKSGDFN